MPKDDHDGWREQRSLAAAAHAESLERRRRAETAEARALVASFVEEATRRGIRPRRLRATAYSGRASYRTRLRGWLLLRTGSLAVDTEGNFYVLTVPPSFLARIVGASPAPSDPPLAVGRGARDGESMSLALLLRLRLDGGDDWP